MPRIVAGQRTLRQWWCTVWLAVLGLAGAWLLLRRHWGTSLVWLFTLASCGVTAEAVWNGRPHERNASHAALWGTVAMWALVTRRSGPWGAPGVSMMVLGLITLTSFLMVINAPKPP